MAHDQKRRKQVNDRLGAVASRMNPYLDNEWRARVLAGLTSDHLTKKERLLDSAEFLLGQLEDIYHELSGKRARKTKASKALAPPGPSTPRVTKAAFPRGGLSFKESEQSCKS